MKKIDTTFTPNCGIYHAKERGWQMNETNTSFPEAGDKAAYIRDHTTTEANTYGISVSAKGFKLSPNSLTSLKVFRRFSCRYDNQLVVLIEIAMKSWIAGLIHI